MPLANAASAGDRGPRQVGLRPALPAARGRPSTLVSPIFRHQHGPSSRAAGRGRRLALPVDGSATFNSLSAHAFALCVCAVCSTRWGRGVGSARVRCSRCGVGRVWGVGKQTVGGGCGEAGAWWVFPLAMTALHRVRRTGSYARAPCSDTFASCFTLRFMPPFCALVG